MMSQHSSPGQGASPGSGSGPAASHYGPSSVSLVSPQHHGASPAQSTFTTSSSNMVPAGHHSGGTVMVSTATTVTPASTPNTNTTIIGAGAGPSTGTGQPGQHYISQGGGQTQTYHIFLPTSQGHQVSQYFPGGLLQTAMPGYHVAGPGAPYFTNFINPMLPAANSEFFQANVKSSSRGGGGGHNNYKSRGRGGRGGAGGGQSERNTPGGGGTGGPHSAQQNYQPQPYPAQGYNPGAHTGPQPFPGYPGQPGAQQWNKNNGARSGPPGHSNNWETSSQHSNSSQKKFSSSSGSSETSLSLTTTVQPRLVQQQLAGGYPAQFRHEAPHYYQPRPGLDNIQSKEFVPTKRGRGGRGGSSRGREGADMAGYNANPRPGQQAGVPPQRNATHVYQPRQHNNAIPGRDHIIQLAS